MSTVILDLETVVDEQQWTPPDPATAGPDARTFPPLHAHRVVAAGALWLDDRLRLVKLDLVGSGIDERPRLVALAHLLHDRPTLVTYNGRGFDLPVLRLRCLRHAVVAPELFVDDDHGMGDGRGGRPLEHIDLHQTLGSSGRGPGLDAVARLSGLPGKLLGDGSQVEGWWRAREFERIESYCLSDVVQTALVFLRVQRIAGRLEAEAYRASVLGLLEALALHERLAHLERLIDRERLLGD